MAETVDSLVEDPEDRLALNRFFVATSAYVVGKAEGEVDHPELKRRWNRQLSLDRLIDELVQDHDEQAISEARQFAGQRTVFVGIAARMMEAGREPLIEFVLESVRSDPRLAASRYNGRTLLHLAAGHSCMAVVRLLLGMGVDPDITDTGGHTPLYRVASASREEDGAEIVADLVRAGATVDHCGGVNRSTALHEAARYGRRRIAEALLAAGASRTAKDKKGLTPLDRAVRCRRSNLAALLE